MLFQTLKRDISQGKKTPLSSYYNLYFRDEGSGTQKD
jgi:hypothetical protein